MLLRKTVSLIAVASYMLTATPAYSAVTNGLVAHYPFDGNAKEASGNGPDGTLYNTVTSVPDRHGTPDAAYRFGPSGGSHDHIRIGPDPVFNFNEETPYTVFGWLNLADNSAPQSQFFFSLLRTELGDCAGPESGNFMTLGGVNGNSKLLVSQIVAKGESPESHGVVSNAAPVPGQWFSWAMVYDGTKLHLYRNGDLEDSTDMVMFGPTTNADGRIVVGANRACDFSWNGTIDDLRIFDRALDPEEIANLHEPATCGDGIVGGGEACDDGNDNGLGLRYCLADCSGIDPGICGAAPEINCRTTKPGKSKFRIRDDAVNHRDDVTWRFRKGDATGLMDFGGPVLLDPTIDVCVYDASGAAQPLLTVEIPSGQRCGQNHCWKLRPNRTLDYSKRDALPWGAKRAIFSAGTQGKSSIYLLARGNDQAVGPQGLPVPALPLTLPVTVQMLVDDGANTECWQVIHTTAATNQADHFAAKGP